MTQQEKDNQRAHLLLQHDKANDDLAEKQERVHQLLDQLQAVAETPARALDVREGVLYNALLDEPRPIPAEADVVVAVQDRGTAARRVRELAARLVLLPRSSA